MNSPDSEFQKVWPTNLPNKEYHVYEIVLDPARNLYKTRWRSSESSSDKIEQRWAENRYTVRRCSDDRWKMTDDRWQMTDDRWRMTDDGSWMTDGRWKITDDRWWMTVGLQLLIKYKRLWDFHMIYRDLIDLILLWPLSNFGLSMSVSILRCLSTL